MNAAEGGLEVFVHQTHQVVGIHAFADARKIGDVAKENADLLLGTAGAAQGRIMEETFDELW